jgi:acyl transferase domain-containing protein
LLLMQRLSDARRQGHRVLAVLRGSAVNSDGTSNGLSAPNGLSQERVIGQALAAAGLTASEVDAVEAHGTGTALGDPIEAQALLATYGQDRDPDRPLWLGALKSNIGHTQAAAGVAGVIKMTMAMRHELLPGIVHLDRPSRHVDWSAGTVRPLTELRGWPAAGRPRRAGISSFGISGTNAHLIIEQPEPESAIPGADFTPNPEPAAWLLSAHSAAALRAQARGLLAGPGDAESTDVHGVAHALAVRRTHLRHRAVVVGDRAAMAVGLAALSAGASVDNVRIGTAERHGGGIVFVFPGHGAQWAGMGVALAAGSPRLRAHLHECAALMDELTGWSLLDVLAGAPGAPPLDRVDVLQPAIFAVTTGLARLWMSVGVRPDAVVGHSLGEIAAAHIAGGLSLTAAVRIVVARGKQLLAIAGQGGLLAVSAPVAEVERMLAQLRPKRRMRRTKSRTGELVIGAINGPTAVAVSGGVAALAQLEGACAAAGILARRVAIDYASHSPQVEVLREAFLAALGDVAPERGEISFYSTVTGAAMDTAALDAEYWYANLRSPVRYQAAVEQLCHDRAPVFLECGPHPVLAAPTRDILDSVARDPADRPTVLVSLRRDDGGPAGWLAALGAAHVCGIEIDWAATLPAPAAPIDPATLPSYPFQHSRYWLDPAVAPGDVSSAGLDRELHPLLGAAVELPDGQGWVFTGRVGVGRPGWQADYALWGTPLLPSSALVELAAHAGAKVECRRVREFTVAAPFVLPEHGSVAVRVVVGPIDGQRHRPVTVDSRFGPDAEWTRNAAGVLSDEPAKATVASASWPPRAAQRIDLDAGYAAAAAAGWDLGPSCRAAVAAWRDGDDFYVDLALPEGVAATGFRLHPMLLEAALHPVTHAAATPVAATVWTGAALADTAAATARARVSRLDAHRYAVLLADSGGVPIATVDSVTVAELPRAGLTGSDRIDALPVLRWLRAPRRDGVPASSWALVDVSAEQADRLRAAGVAVTRHAGVAALLNADARPDAVLIGTAVTAGRPGAAADLERLRELLGYFDDGSWLDVRFVVATESAAGVVPGDRVENIAAAAAAGLIAAVAANSPARVTVVDHDNAASSWAALPGLVADGEPRLAIRDGAGYTPRFAGAPIAAPPAPVTPNETVLITGAGTVVAGLVARCVAGRGGARPLLVCPPTATPADHRIPQLGDRADYRPCDLADPVAVAALLAEVPADRPVAAVICIADNAAAVGPALDAAWNLHEHTVAPGRARLVLIGSTAGFLGGGDDATAALDAGLVALAAHRRALGLPAAALLWGGHPAGLRAPGTDDEAVELLGHALWSDHAGIVAARPDRAALRAAALAGALPAPLRGLVRTPPPASAVAVATAAVRWHELPEERARELLLAEVCRAAASVLGHSSAAAVAADRNFTELGLESLTAVRLRDTLGVAVGVALPPTLVYDHPTPRAVAEHLFGRVRPSAPALAGETAGPLAELDRLEAALAALPADAAEREAITARLRSLLSRWQSGAPAAQPAADSERIRQAGVDELLQLIERELDSA